MPDFLTSIADHVAQWSLLKKGLLGFACSVFAVELAFRRFAPRSHAYAAWTRFFQAIGKVWTAAMIAQGLPIAAALFLLFPRLASPLWGLPADRMAATGLSDRMSPGSISELALNDAVAFRVDFDGPPPPPRTRYWRGPVLSLFNGREWRTLSPRPPTWVAP